MIYGVDVSGFQGVVDWAKVKASGISFAFTKASEGTTYTPSNYAHNEVEMLKLKDFVAGTYHFLSSTERPEAQAAYYVSRMKDHCRLALALDVERYVTGGKTHRPTTAQAEAFVAELRKLLPGRKVVGYLPRWYWEELDRPSLAFFDELWQSAYPSGTGSPATLYKKVTSGYWAGYGGHAAPALLQFSSRGLVPGIEGECDVDAYRGNLAALRALLFGESSPPPVSKPTSGALTVDGELGPKTIAALQRALGVTADGAMGPKTIAALQRALGVTADGILGPKTIRALQKHVGAPVDGELGPKTIKALQARLNRGTF